jgi:hydroxymethylpyrimidine/phosphomethylpyrimidine kinase
MTLARRAGRWTEADELPDVTVPKLVLAIGGSDPSGGAGIQADIKAIHANGAYGLSVITSVTAQNSREVASVYHLPGPVVRAQLSAVFSDFEIAAMKIGMLGSEEVVGAVLRVLKDRPIPPLVVDPVLTSSSGFPLLSDAGLAALKRDLLPLARICTPNRHEAEILSGMPIRTLVDAEEAARRIRDLGPRAVVVKGGHLEGAEAADVLLDGDRVRMVSVDRIEPGRAHGTGCAFAAAIAAWLAHGLDAAEAVARAKRYVTEGIRHRVQIGHGEPVCGHLRFVEGPGQGNRE